MLVMMESFSVGAKVAGSRMSANWVISEALVTIWTKKGTFAMALSQRSAPVQEKLKLLQELRKTLTASGFFSMQLATLLVTTPLPAFPPIIAGMSLAPRPSSFFHLPCFLASSSMKSALISQNFLVGALAL